MSDYQRIATAIRFITQHAREQPSLEDIAAAVNLSPFHFQRLFSQWAGTSPKRFLQVLTLERGKFLLRQQLPLLEAADELGLSGSSRLHDHFVQLEAVTPGEYQRAGAGLTIRYGVADTPFGPMFIAQTPRGLCRAAFIATGEDEPDSQQQHHQQHQELNAAEELAALQAEWPQAELCEDNAAAQQLVATLFTGKRSDAGAPLSLHVRGTNFQLAVWRALLTIPAGHALSYGQLATQLGQPTAARAIGNAVGANPVAFIIPCHRVIQQSGALGGYRWGPLRKQVIQSWERLQLAAEQ
ncbi:methylated-DNA--[protein]-cysteine S-methyltransferase [Thalassolituus hydrocarboniclasticus]|uniref:Methylated-DNA--[protein]-cysteine S-methyltransferase n=1 Tax=Thalassolituus hydrocarboniclasticus TaxID=2742796 RepID=A0ABY6ADQ8_9GAMM|nr:methylated-DNA--[protein]-cysteine S-methyltransferase [Thalassolituus hydrocarboniclasticus]UXD88777.1 methylated-DNA--[protein]-cysteine S-methyltransferase [Thalassolituus hydrocarboniclasticus]